MGDASKTTHDSALSLRRSRASHIACKQEKLEGHSRVLKEFLENYPLCLQLCVLLEEVLWQRCNLLAAPNHKSSQLLHVLQAFAVQDRSEVSDLLSSESLSNTHLFLKQNTFSHHTTKGSVPGTK